MIASVATFGIGSAVAGSSGSSGMLTAGRTIQGVGSARIMLLMEVIVCDIVPLRRRGKYMSFTLSWCAAGAVVGRPVGGAIAQKNWRWIFYLRVPISGLVLMLMIVCLRLQHRAEPTRARALARVDWIGNGIFMGALTSILFGLVFSGTVFPWRSWHVVLPLAVWPVGWIAFHGLDRSKYCKKPTVTKHIIGNRTSIGALGLVFLSSVLTTWFAFAWPLYWQAVFGTLPLKAGTNYLVFEAFAIPSAAVADQLLARLGVYRPIHLFGFLLSTLDADSPYSYPRPQKQLFGQFS
ncbi:MFS general substrate transporter [Trematosphaeria pertusa]|uniref:MFS general substrate transporter n=1 Tax=Trematosphaeria pertusa TaxID=390896 RepID=A0A6A6HSF2_9PLEO|nr:MFS general substrate transporter [Trematosphaeria pertusa]KAF2240360.1 MFS general substrate transporter [Trematosphaeria pertusa]